LWTRFIGIANSWRSNAAIVADREPTLVVGGIIGQVDAFLTA
jgi:hypothetical protein